MDRNFVASRVRDAVGLGQDTAGVSAVCDEIFAYVLANVAPPAKTPEMKQAFNEAMFQSNDDLSKMSEAEIAAIDSDLKVAWIALQNLIRVHRVPMDTKLTPNFDPFVTAFCAPPEAPAAAPAEPAPV